jgi:hypothetical protein
MTAEQLYNGVGYISNLPNLDGILNLEPRKDWIKEHPQVKGFMYLPIERVEFLLSRLYKDVQIEIRSVISTDTRAVVTIRVNYTNREGARMFHDGIGAVNITKSQPAEMSFPMAKTLAMKDACDMFGKVFGKDLNRKEISIVSSQKELTKAQSESLNEISKMVSKCGTTDELNLLWLDVYLGLDKDIIKTVKAMFTKRKVEING